MGRISRCRGCRCATLVALLCGLWSLSAFANAASTGSPLISQFGAKDIPAIPKFLSLLADGGELYIGNIEGLLVRSGGRFELLRLPNEAQARGMARGADGRLYIGAYDHIGYVERDAAGRLSFTDLLPDFALPDDQRFIGDVLEVHSRPDGIWFVSQNHLLFAGYDGTRKDVRPPGPLRRLFDVDGQFYARISDLGLTRFDGRSFTLIADGASFAQRSVYALLRHHGKLLALTRDDGFLELGDSQAKPLETAADAWLKTAEPYAIVELFDHSYAVATLQGDVLHLDREFGPLGRFHISDQALVGLAADREGGLWAAAEGELVRIGLPSAWSSFSHGDGFLGSPNDSVMHAGQRYIASTAGLYAGNTDAAGHLRFTRQAWSRDEVWDLESTTDGLFIAARDGVRLLVPNEPQPVAIASVTLPWRLQPSRYQTGRMLVAYEPGLLILERGKSGYAETLRFSPSDLSLGSVVETSAQELWLGNYRGAPIRLRLRAGMPASIESERRFGQSDGLPVQADSTSNLFQLDGRLYVGLDERLFRLDGERFVELSAAERGVPGRPGELSVREAPDHSVYAYTARRLWHRADAGSSFVEVERGVAASGGVVELSFDDAHAISISGWDAVYRYDPLVGMPSGPQLSAFLSRVSLRGDDGHEQLVDRRAEQMIVMPPLRALAFDFAVDSMVGAADFRSRLQGLENDFTPWSRSDRREFAALASGEYVLLLEGRIANGQGTHAFRYPFRVAPRWYEMRWLQFGVLLLLALVMLLVARVHATRRVERFRARNRELEDVVAARTRQLEFANRQLARLASLDGLTGITNRRGFDSELAERWRGSAAAGQPLALLMIDVDHFKNYNDLHGHLAGDSALRSLAQTLSRLARESETLARFGGEEFALVIANADLVQARERAEQIRHHFETIADCAQLTVSIGVASMIPPADGSSEQLIEAADQALYRAKHQGRNRVECAST